MTTSTRMTAEEYFAVSVERDFAELVDGEMVFTQPTIDHGLVTRNLLVEFAIWERAEPGRGLALPPGDIVLDDFNVYAPDVMWIREERVPDPVQGQLSGLPDLAVEIRSPSTWRHVLKKKLPVYERSGLAELWLMDNVAESVRVLRRSGPKAVAFDDALELTGTDALTSPQLPGFAVAVERLFRR